MLLLHLNSITKTFIWALIIIGVTDLEFDVKLFNRAVHFFLSLVFPHDGMHNFVVVGFDSM